MSFRTNQEIDCVAKNRQDPILEIPSQRLQSQSQKVLSHSEWYCLPKCHYDKSRCLLYQFHLKFQEVSLLFLLFGDQEFLRDISKMGWNLDALMVYAFDLPNSLLKNNLIAKQAFRCRRKWGLLLLLLVILEICSQRVLSIFTGLDWWISANCLLFLG